MTEYIYKILSPKGDNDFWPEQLDGMGKHAPSLEKLIDEIEDHESDGYRLACVFKIECVDGEYTAENITDRIQLILSENEADRAALSREENREGSYADFKRELTGAE